MKTILYMAMTVNGNIARVNGDSSWTSEEDGIAFKKACQSVDAIIIGKNTYNVVMKEHIQKKNRLTVVLTHDNSLTDNQNTMFTSKSPKEILDMLEQKGMKSTMIAGGGVINSLFLNAGLVDELYIDIEPLVLGRGIPLFADSNFEKKLKLLSVTKLNGNTIQLHYQVIQ